LNQYDDTHEDISRAIQTKAPEKVVVEDPPPEPDYPRYRVEPGNKASLAAIAPDETEHYRKKKDVARELEKQRRRIQDLQERLYAENERGMQIVLQAMSARSSKTWLPVAEGPANDGYAVVYSQGASSRLTVQRYATASRLLRLPLSTRGRR